MNLTNDQRTLLSRVPDNGDAIGNRMLQRALRWNADRYWTVRDELVDAGYIVRGRGRGGSVRRATEVGAASMDEFSPTAPWVEASQQESDLYEPVRRIIASDWARDRRRDPIAVEITAMQGRRDTGGIWSRPDITSVEVREFEFLPGKHLELTTFEVKRADALNVQSVFEALAHRRAATSAYVLGHVSVDKISDADESIQDVAAVARMHGVGFITAGAPDDYETWSEHVEAGRVEPDPVRLNEFITAQLSPDARRQISLRVR